MTLSIRDPETDRLARDLARRTGKPITTVVKEALAEYAAKAPASTHQERLRGVEDLLAEFDALDIADARDSKALLDDLYDENGLLA